MSIKDYHKRPPDYDGAHVRGWQETTKEKPEINPNDFKVQYKEMEFILTGFNKVLDNGEVQFLWKVKSKTQELCIYQVADNAKTFEAIQILIFSAELTGFHVIDVEDTLAESYEWAMKTHGSNK